MKKIVSLGRRIIIALIFVIVLGAVAPTVVFYSLGYRFDWNKKIFVHSGSVVIKSTPTNVNISLDGKQISTKNIDYINQTTNINGLTPKKYQLEVSVPGYQTWKKEAEIHSGIATEYWNVLLPPQNITKTNAMSNNLLVYAFSPDKKNLAYFVKQDEWISLFIRDKDNKEIFIYKESVNQRFVPKEGELKWSGDGKWLIFSLKQDDKEKIFLASADDGYKTIVQLGEVWKNTLFSSSNPQDNQSNSNANSNNFNSNLNSNKLSKTNKEQQVISQGGLVAQEEGVEATYSWDKKDNIYFVFNGNLYAQGASQVFDWWNNRNLILLDNNNSNQDNSNLNKKLSLKNNSNVNKPLNEENKTGEDKVISQDQNAYPKKISEGLSGFTFCDNYICEVNLQKKDVQFINDSGAVDSEISFPEGYEVKGKYKLFAYGSDRLAIVDDNNNLFLWDGKTPIKDVSTKVFKLLNKSVKEVYFSDDGKKLLFSTDNEAYVYFLREWEVQPKHNAGDIELVWKQEPKIERIQWYLDYQHIFVVNKDAVKIIELDERGGQNVFDFFTGNNITGFDYSTGDKKLWFLESDNNGTNKLEEISFPPSTSFINSFIGGQSINNGQ